VNIGYFLRSNEKILNMIPFLLLKEWVWFVWTIKWYFFYY